MPSAPNVMEVSRSRSGNCGSSPAVSSTMAPYLPISRLASSPLTDRRSLPAVPISGRIITHDRVGVLACQEWGDRSSALVNTAMTHAQFNIAENVLYTQHTKRHRKEVHPKD